MKNSLFDWKFSCESYVFYHQNSPSLKFYLLWLYIVKKQRFGVAPRRCEICSKLSFNATNLSFHSFWNPSMHVYARVCMCMHTHSLSMRAHTCICVHMPQGLRSIYFLKIVLFFQKISYIFHKYFSQDNFHLIGS